MKKKHRDLVTRASVAAAIVASGAGCRSNRPLVPYAPSSSLAAQLPRDQLITEVSNLVQREIPLRLNEYSADKSKPTADVINFVDPNNLTCDVSMLGIPNMTSTLDTSVNLFSKGAIENSYTMRVNGEIPENETSQNVAYTRSISAQGPSFVSQETFEDSLRKALEATSTMNLRRFDAQLRTTREQLISGEVKPTIKNETSLAK